MSEYTRYQLGYIESVDGHAHQSAVDIIGTLEQQRNALLSALKEAIGIIDCLRDYVCEGGSIGLVGAISAVSDADNFMEGKAKAAIAAVEGE